MKNITNSVQLIGNLGKTPEIKNFEGGKKVARVSIATTDSYKSAKGEKVKETQWHNLVAWGKCADIMERYLKKGSEVAIQGKLTSRSYDDKDGIKRYITEIKVQELKLLGSKNDSDDK
ncbi:MAG TPA: single-stranded DNA-binding protein [Bacteroidia bacterium]|jgi:single-strand DNA-binding protein|nr:single-stranded DNA-binding protein [Bacteroidia bacterium]